MAEVLTEYCAVHLATDDTQAGGGVAGVLNGAKVRLAKDLFVPSKNTVVADVHAPTYTGYADTVITWGAAHRDGSGDIVTESQEVTIQMGDSALPTTIYGYAVIDGAAANVLFSEVFPSPLSLVDVLSFFGLQIPFAPATPQSKAAIVTS